MIAEFVAALMVAGCDIWAVGAGYVLGEPCDEAARSEVGKILKAFGPREHLLPQINRHLRRIGRSVDVDRNLTLLN